MARTDAEDPAATRGRPGSMADTPLVTVSIVTYNHRPYIEQAIDSVLMQETTFPFEICLGEDESTDGTREICREYAARHPDRIRLFLRSRKDVIHIFGHATGRQNARPAAINSHGVHSPTR